MSEANSFEDFVQRFHGLATEAESYGFQSISMVMDSNPITRLETKDVIWRGGSMACIGLCEWAKGHLIRSKAE